MLLSTLFFIKECEKVVDDYSLSDEINRLIQWHREKCLHTRATPF